MFFFFNDTATTEIYTLSLHDALPIFHGLKHPEQYAIGHAKQNVAANERIADLPTDQTHPSNQRMGIAPANKRLQSEIKHSREGGDEEDRKSTRLNSSHSQISYAVFCLKKKSR